MMKSFGYALVLAALLPLGACGGSGGDRATAEGGSPFMSALRDDCGRAYRGTMVAGENEEMAGKELILAIAPCTPDGGVDMALHVNVGPLQVSRDAEVWDRSRGIGVSEAGGKLSVTLADHKEDGSAGPQQGMTAAEAPGGSDSRANFALPGAEEPLEIEVGKEAIMLKVPDLGDSKGYRAEFETSDRVAMPPPAWGRGPN